mgnify:CR=1 FL=1
MTLANRLGFAETPLFLVDGSAYIYRGYHAFRDLARSDGFPTSALFMIFRLLFKILKEQEPRHLVFFLDGKGPTFRSNIYAAYKANREAMPEPLARQLAPLRQGLALLGVPVIIPQGAEADDGIASLAARFSPSLPVVIVGADKDLKQCLSDRVALYDPSGKTERLTTLADFTAECGIAPASWPDLQALVGDTSDNIPGIPGVGPKTAAGILRDCSSLDGFFAAPEQVANAKLRDKLLNARELIDRNRKLIRLRGDWPEQLPAAAAALNKQVPDWSQVAAIFREYELRSLLRDLPETAEPMPEAAVRTETAPALQPSPDGDLFSWRQETPAPAAEDDAKPRDDDFFAGWPKH